MALRLTTAKTAFETTRKPGAEALELGKLALSTSDIKRYRDLLAECASEPDYNRRYKARRVLVELGFAHLQKIGETQVAPLALALAGGIVEALEDEPREPVMLNYGGVAFYEIGALKVAEALFKAARRLDKELPHVRKNLDEIQRRRRGGIDVVARMPANLAATLKGLSVRAERAASKAMPVQGLTLSLAMIVKDEEEMLPRCLAAVKDHVDEMIIVDTGSTDRTVEIAESFGAKVLHHEWSGDFADARNVSFDAATGDWVLYLDADEVMVEDDVQRLRELTTRVWREAFYLVETNFTGDLGDGTAVTHNALRVFRNREEYRFEGRLHEQIAHRLPAFNPERLEATTIRMDHYGYLGTVRDAKEKSRRNIELLEKQAEEGSSPGPFLYFNLGSEYAAAGDSVRAEEEFEKSWKMLKAQDTLDGYGFIPSLISRLTKAYRVNGKYALCRDHAEQGLELFPGFTDLIFEQAHSYHNELKFDTASELFEQCIELGDAPSQYSATHGCGTFMAMSSLAETRRAQGRHADAVALLRKCLAEYPTFLGAVMPLAQSMLIDGAQANDVVAAVEELVADMTPSVRFMLGAALYEAGHPVAAEPLFRKTLERQPNSAPVLIALAEALLSQRRWEETVETAKGVEFGGYSHTAVRAELFGAIMAGDESAYSDALARATEWEIPSEQLVVFEGWHAAETGGQVPTQIPLETVPLLATILEALLRVEEVDAYAHLLPLLHAAPLPARERHELLAQIYLRRGFLESAADEWVAAYQDFGPDVRSLLGLAQVALVREMPEDAATFAAEAQAMEPGNENAERLLARITATA